MTLTTRLYIGGVIAAGSWLLAAQAPRTYEQPGAAATFLAAMLLISLFKLRLPFLPGPSTLSMAYVVDFAVIVTLGADLAMVIAAAGVLAQCTVRVRRHPWYRTAFSVAAVVLSVQAAGWTWAVLGGTISDPGLQSTVLPLALAAVMYFAVNSGLVAGAIVLSRQNAMAASSAGSLAATAPACLVAAAAAAAIQILVAREMYLLVPAAALPVLLCHVAYGVWFRRLAARPAAPALT